jgi:hypothetical protein
MEGNVMDVEEDEKEDRKEWIGILRADVKRGEGTSVANWQKFRLQNTNLAPQKCQRPKIRSRIFGRIKMAEKWPNFF